MDDLIVGAPLAGTGKAYVIYGSKGSWSSPISLSSLNGVNGFSINEFRWDKAGISVSGAGDINDDGIADFVVGAPRSFKQCRSKLCRFWYEHNTIYDNNYFYQTTTPETTGASTTTPTTTTTTPTTTTTQATTTPTRASTSYDSDNYYHNFQKQQLKLKLFHLQVQALLRLRQLLPTTPTTHSNYHYSTY